MATGPVSHRAELYPPLAVGLDADARAASRSSQARTLRWATRGCWAVFDQALFASSGLVVNIMLARWLSPVEYGAFVTAHTVLLMASVLHTSFLSEPMLIYGSGKYRDRFSHYFSVLHGYHWRLTLAVSAAMVVAALVLYLGGYRVVATAFAGMSLAAPVILLSWLARRACYAVSEPRWSAIAGAWNLVVISLGTAALAGAGLLSIVSAQLLMAAAALGASAWMMPSLLRLTKTPIPVSELSNVWPDHWTYGRWSGAAGALAWLQAYIYYLVLPLWGGLAATASLRAVMNLVLPILLSDSALITLLSPVFVRLRSDASRFRRLIGWCIAAFSLEAIVYWILLLMLGERLLEWMYGGAYRYDTRVLLLVGSLPLFNSLVNVMGTVLRAREQVDSVVWATTASVFVTITFGAAAIALGGLDGAVLAMACAAFVQAMFMTVLVRRQRARSAA